MTEWNGLIPNLLQGVSQQPRLERRPEQLATQVNCLSNVTQGLGNRGGTQLFVYDDILDFPSDAAYHTYDRGDTEEAYGIVITSGGIKVTDLVNGTDKTVNLGSSAGYLISSNPKEDFAFHTIADTTFIVNKSILPEMSNPSPVESINKVIIYCKAARYGMTYSIHENDTLIAECTTPETVTVTSGQQNMTNQLETHDVLECLWTGANVGLVVWNATGTYAGGLSAYATAQGYDVADKNKNILYLEDAAIDIKISVSDSTDGEDLVTFESEVDTPQTLPRVGYHGHKVRVVGIDDNIYNDYYLEFEADKGSGIDHGVWKESIGFGLNQSLTAGTMPHILTRESDGSFLLAPPEWVDRAAGDDDTNPIPSFVGKKIEDVVSFQGRLVFLCEESVIASVTFDHYNFFAETVLQESALDPIDTASSDNQVTNLHHALVFNSSLLTFSDRAQFLHPGQIPFSTGTFGLSSKSSFKNNLECAPVAAETSVFFSFDQGNFTSIREMKIENVTGNMNVNSVTSHCDRYIPGSAKQMVTSTDYNILVIRPGNDSKALYLYQWYYQDNTKRQSAWHKWTFNYDIRNVAILQNKLFIWKVVNSIMSIEYIDLTQTDTTGVAFPVRLDQHKIITGTDDTDYWKIDVSDWTVNRGISRDDLTVIAGEDTGIAGGKTVYENHPTDANAFRVLKGSVFPVGTPNFIVGSNFTAYGEITNPYVRMKNGQPMTKERLRLGSFKFNCSDTGSLNIIVEKDYNLTYTKEYNGRIIDGGFILDRPPALLDPEIQASVRSDAARCRIKFQSDSHLPFNINSIDWSGSYHETGRRTI